MGHKLSILLLAGISSPSVIAINLLADLSTIAQTIPTIPKPIEPNRVVESLPSSNKPQIQILQPQPLPSSFIQSPQIPSVTPTELPEAEVIVREIKVLGSTVFSEAELQQAVAS